MNEIELILDFTSRLISVCCLIGVFARSIVVCRPLLLYCLECSLSCYWCARFDQLINECSLPSEFDSLLNQVVIRSMQEMKSLLPRRISQVLSAVQLRETSECACAGSISCRLPTFLSTIGCALLRFGARIA